MSNQSAPAGKHPDQPFQVVQKRSYSQGRRGGSRDRPTFRHGDDAPRKKPPAPKESREQRTRPQSIRSTQSARGKVENVDCRHEESWEDDSKSSGEKITSPNRFQKLDPDLENSMLVDHKKSSGKVSKTRSSSGSNMAATGSKGHNRGKSPPVSKTPSESELKEKVTESGSKEIVTVTQPPPPPVVASNGVSHNESQCELEAGATIAENSTSNSSSSSSSSKLCENGEVKENAKPESKINRISYTKERLLSMRHHNSCERVPKELCNKMHESMLSGKSFASLNAGGDPLDDSDNEKPAESAKPKHPTALSLLRELGDSKHMTKVCLSPQRRSFGSGCSWKETATNNSNSSEAPPPTPPPTSKSSSDDRGGEKYFHPSSSSSSSTSSRPHSFHHYQPPPSSPHTHTPRVIDHVPLRERERDRRGAWRGRDDWRQNKYEHHNAEPEPEWMEFGPSDRSEVIELKGFEEDKPSGGALEGEGEPPPAMAESASPPPVENTAAGAGGGEADESSNEFILEGFDFSTGLSICQELALDEEEEEPITITTSSSSSSATPARSKPLPQPSTISAPPPPSSSSSSSSSSQVQLSQHLMKMLNMGRDTNTAGSSVSHPANALTLDEIQARENIEPQHQPHVGQDQTAFNKLVAVLQYSGAIDESSSQQKHESPSKPQQQQQQQAINLPPPATSSERKTADFGLLLEEELGFDDELPPPAPFPPQQQHPVYHHTAAGRQQQQQQQQGGMHKMDPSMLHLLSQQQRPIPHPGRVAPHHTNPMAPHQQRDSGGSWISSYPESELGRQTAAGEQLRQQQQQQSQHHRLRQQQQQQLMAGGGGGGGSGRPSNQWAIEMERRRLVELQQMERERMYNYPQQMPPLSKPNISLLPTAVMRQIHNNSKTTHSLSEASKASDSSIMANRLDQDLTSKASQTHSTITSMLNHSEPAAAAADYPSSSYHHQQQQQQQQQQQTAGATTRLRSPASYSHVRQQQQQQHVDPALMYPPRYLPTLSHGLPAQNPYMY